MHFETVYRDILSSLLNTYSDVSFMSILREELKKAWQKEGQIGISKVLFDFNSMVHDYFQNPTGNNSLQRFLDKHRQRTYSRHVASTKSRSYDSWYDVFDNVEYMKIKKNNIKEDKIKNEIINNVYKSWLNIGD